MRKVSSPKGFRPGSIQFCLVELVDKLQAVMLELREIQNILKCNPLAKSAYLDWLDLAAEIFRIPSHQFKALVGCNGTTPRDNESRLILAVEANAHKQLKLPEMSLNYIWQVSILANANDKLEDKRTELSVAQLTNTDDQRVFLEAYNIFIPLREKPEGDINKPYGRAFAMPVRKILEEVFLRDNEIALARKNARSLADYNVMLAARLRDLWNRTPVEEHAFGVSYLSFCNGDNKNATEAEFSKSCKFSNVESHKAWAIETLMLLLGTLQVDAVQLLQAFQHIVTSVCGNDAALEKMLLLYKDVTLDRQGLDDSFIAYKAWWEENPLSELRDALFPLNAELPPLLESFKMQFQKLQLSVRNCILHIATINLAHPDHNATKELTKLEQFCDALQDGCLAIQKRLERVGEITKVPEATPRSGFFFSYTKFQEIAKLVLQSYKDGSQINATQVERVMNSESTSTSSSSQNTTPRAEITSSTDSGSPNFGRSKDPAVPPVQPSDTKTAEAPEKVEPGHGSIKMRGALPPLPTDPESKQNFAKKSASVRGREGVEGGNPSSRSNTIQASGSKKRGSAAGLWDRPQRKTDGDISIDLSSIVAAEPALGSKSRDPKK